jgi:hypothetical protein
MSHTLHISDKLYEKIAAYAGEQGQPVDAFAEECLAAAIDQLDSAPQPDEQDTYDPAKDPIAPFIGAFAFEDDPGLMERHDEYFAGEGKRDAASE